jgi:TPP-dependent indolepyruvate ferredoxin oxidoreductase alpha subunit
MAINLEVKHRLQAIEARLKVLEERQIHPQAVRVVEEPQESKEPKKNMCPKCGVKPAYFFHVKHCKAEKNKNNGDDGNRSTSDA